MSVLIDVNLLLACAWQTHARHADTVAWLRTAGPIHVCTAVELGFLRVSMGPGFRVPFATALQALNDAKRRGSITLASGDLETTRLPQLSTHSEVTDAYFVEVARANGFRLATLDDALCLKSWAAGVAFNPLAQTALP